MNVMCVEVLHVLKNVWFDEEILFSEKVEIQSDTINFIRTKIDRFPEDFERTLGNSFGKQIERIKIYESDSVPL